jgi:AhpD family alkylhydroperoxidase
MDSKYFLKNLPKLVQTQKFACLTGRNQIQKTMETRLKLLEKGMGAVKTLFNLSNYIKKSNIDAQLAHLIEFRVSQINGCAYCLDMHWKDAIALGESEQRLYGLSAWRESPYYTPRERAALAWVESVTNACVPDDVYSDAEAQFKDEELIDLTIIATTINTWNRLNIAFPPEVGSYRVGQFA